MKKKRRDGQSAIGLTPKVAKPEPEMPMARVSGATTSAPATTDSPYYAFHGSQFASVTPVTVFSGLMLVLLGLHLLRALRLVERIISFVLSTAFGGVFAPISHRQVAVSAWTGTLALTDVAMRPDRLPDADMPVALAALRVESAQLAVAWRTWGRTVASVRLEGVHVTLLPRHVPKAAKAEQLFAAAARKQRAAAVARLDALDRVMAWPRTSRAAPRRSLLSALASRCAVAASRRLEVTVARVAVTLGEAPQAAGSPIPASLLSIKVDSFSWLQAPSPGTARVAIAATVKGLCLDCIDAGTGGTTMPVVMPLVRRWGVRAAVTWSPGVPRPFPGRITLRATAAPLTVALPTRAIARLMLPASALAASLRHRRHAVLRPKASVTEAPDRWWRYAVAAIQAERRAVLFEGQPPRDTRLAARRGRRLAYARAREAALGGQGWGGWGGAPALATLSHMESSLLTVSDVAQFRWMATASANARRGFWRSWAGNLLAGRRDAATAARRLSLVESMSELEAVLAIPSSSLPHLCTTGEPPAVDWSLAASKISVVLGGTGHDGASPLLAVTVVALDVTGAASTVPGAAAGGRLPGTRRLEINAILGRFMLDVSAAAAASGSPGMVALPLLACPGLTARWERHLTAPTLVVTASPISITIAPGSLLTTLSALRPFTSPRGSPQPSSPSTLAADILAAAGLPPSQWSRLRSRSRPMEWRVTVDGLSAHAACRPLGMEAESPPTALTLELSGVTVGTMGAASVLPRTCEDSASDVETARQTAKRPSVGGRGTPTAGVSTHTRLPLLHTAPPAVHRVDVAATLTCNVVGGTPGAFRPPLLAPCAVSVVVETRAAGGRRLTSVAIAAPALRLLLSSSALEAALRLMPIDDNRHATTVHMAAAPASSSSSAHSLLVVTARVPLFTAALARTVPVAKGTVSGDRPGAPSEEPLCTLELRDAQFRLERGRPSSGMEVGACARAVALVAHGTTSGAGGATTGGRGAPYYICRPPPAGAIWRARFDRTVVRRAFEAWWTLRSRAPKGGAGEGSHVGGACLWGAFVGEPLAKASAQWHFRWQQPAPEVEPAVPARLDVCGTFCAVTLSAAVLGELLRAAGHLRDVSRAHIHLHAQAPESTTPPAPRVPLRLRWEVGGAHFILEHMRTKFASLLAVDLRGEAGSAIGRTPGTNTAASLSVGDLQLLDLLSGSRRYRRVLQPNRGLGNCGYRCHVSSRHEVADARPSPPQLLIRCELRSAHVTLVLRFIKDLTAFAHDLQATCADARWPSRAAAVPHPTPPSDAVCPRPPLLSLLVYGLQVDMPRGSWADDKYTLRCARLQVLQPASEDHCATVSHFNRATADWGTAANPGRTATATPPVPGATGPFAGPLREADEAFYRQFASAPPLEGGAPLLAVVGASLSVHWARDATGGTAHEHQVVRGADVLVTIQRGRGQPMRIGVRWPWLAVTFGEAQYSLLMGIIFDNSREPGNFRRPPNPPPKPGSAIPPPTPPPATLGIDGESPKWLLTVHASEASVLIEGLSPDGAATGFGPSIASVRYRHVAIEVAKYPSTSLRVRIAAAGVAIRDLSTPGAAPADCLIVDCPRPVAAAANRGRSTDNGSVGSDSRRRPAGESLFGTSNSTGGGTEAGRETVIFEYVIHKRADAPAGAAGTHVMELRLTSAALQWPHLTDLSWVVAIAVTYTQYFKRPTCNPLREYTGPGRWFYISILMDDSKCSLPFRAVQPPVAGPASVSRAVTGRGGGILGGGSVFQLAWTGLRVAYFWGGDGERTVRVNADELTGRLTALTGGGGRELFAPLTCALEMQRKQPRGGGASTVALSAKCDHLLLQPAFSHLPALQAAFTAMAHHLHTRTQAAAAAAAAASGGPPVVPAVTPSAVKHTWHVEAGSLGAVLLDDRAGGAYTVFKVAVTSLLSDGKVEQMPGGVSDAAAPPLKMSGALRLRLAGHYLNSASEVLEPFLDALPVAADAKTIGGTASFVVHSDSEMNLTCTADALRAVGDAAHFVHWLRKMAYRGDGATGPANVSSSTASSRQLAALAEAAAAAPPAGHQSHRNLPPEDPHCAYRIANRSGARLTYWAEAADGERRTYLVEPDGEGPLLCTPLERLVSFPDGLQLVAKTIALQLEGGWSPLSDIVVDKVGRHVRQATSPLVDTPTALHLEVAVHGRVKVLHVASPMRLVNKLPVAITFWLHQPNMTGLGGAASRVRAIGPVPPGKDAHVPLSAVCGGLLSVQPAGHERAEKDVVRLDAHTLKQQQGRLMSRVTGGSAIFTCCLQVIGSESTFHGMVAQQHELHFLPPLTLLNALPFPAAMRLADTRGGDGGQEFTLAAGEAIGVCSFDMHRELFLIVEIAMESGHVYKSKRATVVHRPPQSFLGGQMQWLVDEETMADGSLFDSLYRGSMPRSIKFVQRKAPVAQGEAASRHAAVSMTRFKLHVSNVADFHSQSRRVDIFSPYWLINETAVAISARQGTGTAPVTCAPAGPGGSDSGPVLAPILYTPPRGAVDISLGLTADNLRHKSRARRFYWSPSVPLAMAGTTSTALLVTVDRPDAAVRSLAVLSEGPGPRISDATSEEKKEETALCGLFGSRSRHETQMRVEIGISVSQAANVFAQTKTIRLVPRFHVKNATGQALEFKQRGCPDALTLHDGLAAPILWFNAEQRAEIIVRPAIGGWAWSGGFRVDEAGEHGLRLRRKDSLERLVLHVCVSLAGPSVVASVSSDPTTPPYRIENQCSATEIAFKQRDLEGLEAYDTIGPKQTIPFAWDEPTLPHKLKVRVTGLATSREYSLDDIRAQPAMTINTRPSTPQPPAVDAIAATAKRSASQHIIFVNVYADGPIRVLRFTDSKDDQMSHETEEENLQILARKLQRIEANMREVDSRLTAYEQAGTHKKHHRLSIEEIEPGEDGRVVTPNRPFRRGKSESTGDSTNASHVELDLAVLATTPLQNRFGTGPAPSPPQFLQQRHTIAAGFDGIGALVRDESSPRQLGSSLPAQLDVAPRSSRKEVVFDCSVKQDEDVPKESHHLEGGELVVRVVKADRLWTSGGAPFDPYVTLLCEGQQQKTAVQRKTSNPIWNEEVLFKSVHTSSDLHVIVHGQQEGLFGAETFLGEAFVSLSNVTDSGVAGGKPDLRQYTLARRNAKDHVDGVIFLEVSWNVTPLELLTLKVKAREKEIEVKEEMLALITEKKQYPSVVPANRRNASYFAKANDEIQPLEEDLMHKRRHSMLPYGRAVDDLALPLRSTSEALSFSVNALDSFHRMPPTKTLTELDGRPESLVTRVGELRIKVVEARNLILPERTLGGLGFYTCDAFARVSVSSRATQQSKVASNSLSPQWNESFAFENVSVSARVTIQVYDRKTLHYDVLLGEASLPCTMFQDRLPRYMWVALSRKGDETEACGELRLRVHWREHEDSREESDQQAIVVELAVHSIGVSFIQDHQTLQRELMHVTIEGISLQYKITPTERMAKFLVGMCQIDNQLISAANPVIFAAAADRDVGSGDDKARPLLEVSWVQLTTNPSILHFRYFSVLLQEVDLLLEEEHLDAVISMAQSMAAELAKAKGSPNAVDEDASPETALALLFASTAGTMLREEGRTRERKWYFELLHFHPVKANVTITVLPGIKRSGTPGFLIQRFTSAAGITLIDINHVPLCLNSMALKNAFLGREALTNQVLRHLAFQAVQEFYKILGSVELLGTPINLISNLGTGVVDFFYEPAKGIVHSPEEFARGIATGTLSLLKNSMYGVFNTVSQVTGTLGKSLAVLALDDEYLRRAQRRTGATAQETLLQGAQDLGTGFYEGITGLVSKPIAGAEREGVYGFFKGVATGLVGAVIKPTAGVVQAVGKTVGSVGAAIRESTQMLGGVEESTQRTRVKSPRLFEGGQPQLQKGGNWADLLNKIRDGRYRDEVVVDSFINKKNKVFLITNVRVLYINTTTEALRWTVRKADVMGLGSAPGRWNSVIIKFRRQLRLPSWACLIGMETMATHRVRCFDRGAYRALLEKIASWQSSLGDTQPNFATQESDASKYVPSEAGVVDASASAKPSAIAYSLFGRKPPNH